MAASSDLRSLAGAEVVGLWQQSEGEPDPTDGVGLIGNLFESCLQLLKLSLAAARKAETAHPLLNALESNLATLFFWNEEFGASRGDLDKAMEYSEVTYDLTLSIFVSIGDFLSHDLLQAAFPSLPDRYATLQKSTIGAQMDKARGVLMDWDEPAREDLDGPEEVCHMLDVRIGRLKILGSILEDLVPSVPNVEEAPRLFMFQDRHAHEYHADLIKAKFPHAQASLVEMLGECNWDRYQRIKKKSEENAQREVSSIAEGENKSNFNDSGLGTSISSHSIPDHRYAETVFSHRAEVSHKSLPPLPEEGRNGKPFVCEVCNKTVSIRRTQVWKKHVFADILAYVCILGDCPSDRCFFETREEMTTHLGKQHGLERSWASQKCPLCLEETGDGRNAISIHFSRHMEEIALGALPRSTESDTGSETSSSSAEDNPMAKHVSPTEDSEPTTHLPSSLSLHTMPKRSEENPLSHEHIHLETFEKRIETLHYSFVDALPNGKAFTQLDPISSISSRGSGIQGTSLAPTASSQHVNFPLFQGPSQSTSDPSSIIPMDVCHKCGFRFTSKPRDLKRNRIRHLELACPFRETSAPRIPCSSPGCDRTFLRSCSKRIHEKNKHADEDLPSNIGSDDEQR